MATKTFCDICDTEIPVSRRKYRVMVDDVEHDDVCQVCHQSIIDHIADMGAKGAKAEAVRG